MNKLSATTQLSCLVAAAIFAIAAPGAASADIASDQPQSPGTVVKYADLNVATTQGALTLYSRIHFAALGECSRFDHGDASSKLHKQTCVKQAIQDAVTRANLPALSAVYVAKTRTAAPVIVAAQPQ